MLTSVFSKLTKYGLFVIVLFLEIASYACGDEFCYVDSECSYNSNSHERFLLYDVNPPEGFNLRRDVYMRFAILAHKLKHSEHENLQHFKLVLPPWSHLYHWKYTPVAEQIPWGLYFDLQSIKMYAPVIEMYEFFQAMNRTSAVVIDEVYVLQHFKDMFETGNFKNKMQIEECAENYQINYFFYKNLTSHNVKCLSYHGPATKLSQLLQKSSAKVILLHHAEVALHEMFGNKLYWECRRSMRFSTKLRGIAAQFRRKFLNSTDKVDNTILPEKWQDEKSKRDAKGGPYLSAHIRRQDFLRGRSHQVPTIESIAQQIIKLLEKLNLTQVFIATDASEDGSGDSLNFF
jgi:peptide-O-fucosyltransferase